MFRNPLLKVSLQLATKLIIFFVTFSLFSSCSLHRNILTFETQDYWWYAFNGNEVLFSKLKDLAKKNSMAFKLTILAREKNHTELSELFQNDPHSIVILDPVLTMKYLRQKSGVGRIFMILGNKLKTVKIEYSRELALEVGGKICAEIIGKKSNKKLSQCIVICIDNKSNKDNDLYYFKKGYESSQSEKLSIEKLSNVTNRTKARRVFDKYSYGQNNIYVLLTYSLTSFFLDLIEKKGGFAVVMDPLGNIESDNIIYSIRYDFSGGIERALQLYFEKNNISSVVSNAYIKWGKSYPIPNEYRGESIIVR